jgi:group I intron endonuclease
MSKGKIYCAHCIFTGKKYVGQTRQHLYNRIANHFVDANKGYRKGKFYNALKKYGRNGFIWGVIEECDISLLNDREVYWISEYKTVENGYNLSPGGGQPPEYYSKEYLAENANGERKIIKNLSQYCRDNDLNIAHIHETLYGKRLHHRGHKLIPRTIEEIERYKQERKFREDTSRKGLPGERNGMFNKKHKNETKEKMLKRKRELFAKTYHLISPEGNEVIVTTTLREFCREYGLERKSLTNVLNGKAKHHKRWTVPQVAQDA